MSVLDIQNDYGATYLGCSFVVYGTPLPGGSKSVVPVKDGRSFIVDSNRKKLKPWRQQIADTAIAVMGARLPYEKPLALTVDFYLPRPKSHYGVKGIKPNAPLFPDKRPDSTKLLRPAEDSLTGIVWRDDAQIVEQHVRKLYGEPSRMVVRVHVLGEVMT